MENKKKTILCNNKRCIALTLFCFMLLTTSSYAGKNPDFSGEWTLNNSKSELGEFSWAATTLIIVQDKKAMVITRKGTGFEGEEYEIKEEYTLDGKECVNNIFEAMQKKSTVTWSDDKTSLIITSILNFEREGETMEIKSVENLKLGEDKRNLLIDYSSSSDWGDMEQKMVYDKK